MKTNHDRYLRFCAGMFIVLVWLSLSVAQAQTTNYTLGTTNLLVGPAAGSNSVVLAVTPTTGTWTATTNAAWLHLSTANQSGTGSTNVVFTYDTNSGATRTGILTIASQTLTVTQAGSTYVAAGPVTTLVSSGLIFPVGVAVDGSGNVYIADFDNNAIKEWMVANDTLTTAVSSGVADPVGVAVDTEGNIYNSDNASEAIQEWTAVNSNVTMLVSSGLNYPCGVAVDGSGNVYVADYNNNAIKEWMVADSNVTTLVSSGLSDPYAVAVDASGNVYIADRGHNAIKEWMAADSNVTTLVSSGLSSPSAVAVDGSGNVYIADRGNNAIKKRTAANGVVTTLVSSGLSNPYGVALDGSGNVYLDDNGDEAIKELPHAFVNPTARMETAAAGSDALPVVLPPMENLLAPFAPKSSATNWLTISGVTNGVVSFSFTLNTGSSRTANITLLGQTIPVTQAAPVIGTPPTLTGVEMLGNSVIQFAFTNKTGATFTVVSTTNLSWPLSNWAVVGGPVETPPGMYHFTSQSTTNDSQIFYSVLSP